MDQSNFPNTNIGITYRPEIDGLRALAIIPVVLFHMGFSWIQGGYLGVDVFFVISGFLISSVILNDLECGTFSLRRFWSRRVRRILPALLTMLLTTSIVSAVFCFKPDTIHYGEQGAAASLSVANITLWNQNLDYWATAAQHTPYLHTWSLSVEEQFYLFYPLVLTAVLKFGKASSMISLTLVIVGSFLLSILGKDTTDPTRFYLLPARAWELATGCSLAMIMANRPQRQPSRSSSLLASVGLVLVITPFFYFSEKQNFRGYLAIPVLGSALLIRFASDSESIVRRLLTVPPLPMIGKLSYSLYLWHWPVIVLGSQAGLQNSTALQDQLLTAAIILLLSWLSYQYVETPLRFRWKPSAALWLCLGLLITNLGVSAYLQFRSNLYDTSMYQFAWKGDAYGINPGYIAIRLKQGKKKAPPADDPLLNAYATGGIIHHHGDDTPKVVVLGDSHAMMWSSVIDSITDELQLTTSFYCADAVSPFFTFPLTVPKQTLKGFTPEQRILYDEKRLEYLDKWKPKVVVLVARWDIYTIEKAKPLIEFCGKNGATVLLIEQPPVLYFGDKKAAQYLSYLNLRPQDQTRRYLPTLISEKYVRGTQLVRSLCEQYKFCQFIPIKDLFDGPDQQAWVLDGKELLYYDDDHLSQEGAERARERLMESLRTAIGTP